MSGKKEVRISYTTAHRRGDWRLPSYSVRVQIASVFKLIVPAGKAAPAPPVGPALGQRGLNLMEFCKGFNAATQVALAARLAFYHVVWQRPVADVRDVHFASSLAGLHRRCPVAMLDHRLRRQNFHV